MTEAADLCGLRLHLKEVFNVQLCLPVTSVGIASVCHSHGEFLGIDSQSPLFIQLRGQGVDDPLFCTVITWPHGDIVHSDALYTQHICYSSSVSPLNEEGTCGQGWCFSVRLSVMCLNVCKYWFDIEKVCCDIVVELDQARHFLLIFKGVFTSDWDLWKAQQRVDSVFTPEGCSYCT